MKNEKEQGAPLPAVLDMGNGTIRVLVADALADGSLVVRGAGEEPSAGMDEGRIVDLNSAVAALQRAFRTAELESNRVIQKVVAGVSGEYIKSRAGEGRVVVTGDGKASRKEEEVFEVRGGVVGRRDVYKVREMGVAAVSGGEQEVLDVVNKNYSLDRQHNILNPLGMSGKLLTGRMHLIMAERQSLENIRKCIGKAGVEMEGRPVFSGLAAGRAALNDEEKRLGVCLLDIGAHTSEMVIFCNGGVYETDVYKEAGNLIHMDISKMHHTTLASAEACKKQVGVTLPPADDSAALPMVSTSGEEVSVGHSLILRTAAERVELLLECVAAALRNFEENEGRKLTAGIVLTGGGALLPGLAAMVHNRLQIPVRIGEPAYSGEKRERVKVPAYSAAMGLLMMARDMNSAARTLPMRERLNRFFFHSSPLKEKNHGH